MKKIYTLCFFLFYAFISALAQIESSDSIKTNVKLNEVTITASNFQRTNSHVLIYPNEQQRKHANNGYDILNNLMIPGLTIDGENGNVNVMGLHATLYINGQMADVRDIKVLRPRDIEKIEYHDAPSGKYIKDNIAINYIMKQYRYGGYFQADATQTIGYTHGNYNIATTVNQGSTTYSIFAGTQNKDTKDNETYKMENYRFPDKTITRSIESQNVHVQQYNNYAQLRIQNQKEKHYLVGKLSVINNNAPKNNESGKLTENNQVHDYASNIKQKNITPKLDLYGKFIFENNQSIEIGIHGTYSNNNYDRNYAEKEMSTTTYESEDAYNFQFSLLYNKYGNKNSFSTELYHYHDIWNANYSGSNKAWQHLWAHETLLFTSYDYKISPVWIIKSRVGLSLMGYKLHNSNRFNQLSPRVNLNLQYQKNNQMILWAFNFVNSHHGMDIVNNVQINVNQYIIKKGNPDLKKSNDINTYIYYSNRFNKFGINAIGQYLFSNNQVMNDYYVRDEHLIKSFTNDAQTHYLSGILGAYYIFMQKLNIAADIRFNRTIIDGRLHLQNNDYTCTFRLNWYLRDFAIAPYVNLKNKILDRELMEVRENPIRYGTKVSYSHKNLYAELYLETPFTKSKTSRTLKTPIYDYNSCLYNRFNQQYCNIKVSYTFDFGRKTEKIKNEVDTDVKSSLLRVSQ